MNKEILTKSGKLKKEYLPAVYFDSSVLIDYWMVEGTEIPQDEIEKEIKEKSSTHRVLSLVRDILKSHKQIEKMIEIRKKLLFEKVKVTPVITPLSILELTGWEAEATFKQIASESVGTLLIQKKSKKEIGNYLKKILELRMEESKNKKGKKNFTTELERLISETWINPSYTIAHGFSGLLLADIINFHFSIDTVWQDPCTYSYLQLSAADILHILFAQHLGCDYIASFDSDFKRVEKILNQNGISLLKSPDEILKIL